jgi:hypothetical protein
MAVFVLNTPTLPSPIKGEGIKGRGGFVERGDVTSLDGGGGGKESSFYLLFLNLL